jgi:hypothetical protein
MVCFVFILLYIYLIGSASGRALGKLPVAGTSLNTSAIASAAPLLGQSKSENFTKSSKMSDVDIERESKICRDKLMVKLLQVQETACCWLADLSLNVKRRNDQLGLEADINFSDSNSIAHYKMRCSRGPNDQTISINPMNNIPQPKQRNLTIQYDSQVKNLCFSILKGKKCKNGNRCLYSHDLQKESVYAPLDVNATEDCGSTRGNSNLTRSSSIDEPNPHSSSAPHALWLEWIQRVCCLIPFAASKVMIG